MYFAINNVDYSDCVNKLDISKQANYSAQTNAAGNTVVDYINSKRTIDVGIIPLDDTKVKELLQAIDNIVVSISFLNPLTGELEEVSCLIPENQVSYYTIRADKKQFNGFQLGFQEL